MKRRMIKKVLLAKISNWLTSIEDDEVRAIAKGNVIVSGGSIASMLLGEKVNDFDVYFRNKESCLAVAKYYLKKFCELHPDWESENSKTTKPHIVVDDAGRIKIWIQSAGISGEGSQNGYEYFESCPDDTAQDYVEKVVTEADETDSQPLEESTKSKFRPVYMSANAITLSDKVQLIIRFYGEPDDLHKNFDYVHCMNYWTSWDNELVLNPIALESLLSKQLFYQGSLYPVCSVIRSRKFIQKGWYINAGQFLKMCFQISELDLNDFEVLEEQLTGVDAAYFHQVIDYCKHRQASDSDFKISAPYLISIVDKIFG